MYEYIKLPIFSEFISPVHSFALSFKRYPPQPNALSKNILPSIYWPKLLFCSQGRSEKEKEGFESFLFRKNV